MNSVDVTTKRLLEVLPLLTALVFHAIALDRWLLALAVGLGLLVIVILDLSASPSTRRWYTAGGLGLLAGLAMLAISVPPSGPLSPALLSGLTGMLISVAGFAFLTRSVTVAWISAWLLVALSGQVEMTPMLGVSLMGFVAASLIGAASLAGVFRAGHRIILPLFLFAVMVALATFGIAAAAKRMDGALLKTLEAFYTQNLAASTTGVGHEVTISAKSSITLSQLPLLDLSAKPGLLRTHVMDHFNGQQWSTSLKLRSTSHRFADVPIRPESARRMEMTPLGQLGGSLPSPAGTWDVRGAMPRVAGGWVLRGENEENTMTLIGDAEERLPSEDQPNQENVAVPDELREKLGPLAEELTRTSPTSREKLTDRKKTEQIERFFQNNFTYSLATDLVSQEHPLVTLVNERRPAYCIYFASAMAVMLRTQGIPARLVSGYAPVEVNPITNRVTIRQRDAHAWVEAWLSEEGRFVAFDPTPSRSRTQVIGQSDRPGIISALFGAARSIARRTWLAFTRNPARSLTKLIKSPWVWLLLAGLLVLRFRRRQAKRTASAPESRMESSDPILRKIYGRYVRSLKRAGVAPDPWDTDEELITRLSETMPPAVAATATEFIARYRRARFGGEAVDEQLMELAKLGLPKRS